jgi:hypothetical protein
VKDADAPAPLVLDGELGLAFEEWRAAAADLDGRHAAWQASRERHDVALARLRRLATRTEP